jgi:hypothetical protein
MQKIAHKKSEAPKNGPTESKAVAVSCEKAAMFLLALVTGLHQACGLPMIASVEHAQIPELPVWGRNICEQLKLTILRRLLELKPHDGLVEWRNFGRILGVALRELGFIEHDLRREPNLLGLNDVAKKMRGQNEVLADILSGKNADALFDHFGTSLESSLRVGLGQAPAEQQDFLLGLAEGQTLLLDTQGQFAGDRGRTKIYFELLTRWMEIEEMRQAKPPKTRRDLYQLVAPAMGDNKLERLVWFNDVCDDLGLTMKEPGRPQKPA